MKRITPATVSLGVFAILLGLVTAYSVKRFLEPAPARTATIVVPRVNLPKYSRIREQDIEEIKVPVNEAPTDALHSASVALYRLVKDTVIAGEPLKDEDLYDVGKTPTLAEQLPPGFRAVTVAVDSNDALDGVLVPDSLIDLSLTVRGEHPELGGVSTLTLLKGIKVLATNQDLYPTEERLNQPLRTITVAARPEDANKLILAQRFGTLSVTLRSATEAIQLASHNAGENRVNPASILGLPPVVQKKAQVWRGDSMQELTFTNDQINESREATAAAEQSANRTATESNASTPVAAEGIFSSGF